MRALVRLAESMGFRVQAHDDWRTAIAAVREHKPDVVILDVRMPERNGVELAEELWSVDRDVRIAFVTAFGTAPDELRILSLLDPTLPFVLIDKTRLALDDQTGFKLAFVDPIRKLRAARPVRGPSEPLRDGPDSPFSVPVADYDHLALDAKLELNQRALLEAAAYLAELWETTDAQAVVLSGAPNLARWLTSEVDQFPVESVLRDISLASGRAVYVFSRPVQVEEFRLSGWIGCPAQDYYPTINLEFDAANGPVLLNLHLDTGCPIVALSYEFFLDRGTIVPPSIPVTGLRESGRLYSFFPIELPAIARDDTSSVGVTVSAQMVLDWENSPFARVCPGGRCTGSRPLVRGGFMCGRRLGLVGRSLLVTNRLKIVLDGQRHTTALLD
jgi:CheY-like chemotaxis protein